MQASCVLLPHARQPSPSEACSKARARPTEIDARTHMLLAKPIAPTILRLAIPNATVMIVQILIGLLEVYFVSRTGVDALAGVSPVFPLVSLVVAIAQGALGGGIVTTVARALGAGRIGDASEYAWYALAAGCSAGACDDSRHGCVGSNPLRPHGHLRKCSGDRRLLFVHHFCRRHADLVVQPPDGGGSRHRQFAGSGDRGLRRRLDPRPAFAGTDLWRLWLSRAWSLGRRRRDACVLWFGNAGLRSLSLGPVRRPQAVIVVCQDFRWRRRSPFSVSAECRPSSRPPRI